MDLYQVFIVIVGIISILFGLLVIAKPKILPILVGGYFMITGVIWILRALL